MQPTIEQSRPQAEITGLAVDDNGFLIDHRLWNKEIARQLARNEAIDELSDNQWRAIELVRNRYLKLGAAPLMRHVCRQLELSPIEKTQLFSGCLQLWRIAGLPDPGEEARAHIN